MPDPEDLDRLPASFTTTAASATSSSPVPRLPSVHVHSFSSPHRFFRPTHVSFHPHDHDGSCEDHEARKTGGVARRTTIRYDSRSARKGRYAARPHHLHGKPGLKSNERGGLPPSGGALTLEGRLHTVESEFKPHLDADISFWVAVIFTLGSVVWVINGFTVCLPYYLGYIVNSDDLTTVYFKTSAALAFIGGSLFEVGSYLMVVEALNRGRENDFGQALERLVAEEEEESVIESWKPRKGVDEKRTSMEHVDGRRSTGRHGRQHEVKDDSSNSKRLESGLSIPSHRFVWWGKPIWHDLGYTAAIIQLFAATIFWVATITGLPGVISGYPLDPSIAITDIFFWTPQVVGGWGFIASSLLLMIETQRAWYAPQTAWKTLGWHIGLWNFVGGCGFMICGAMGYAATGGSEHWAEQSGWSTFWGSWAFLLGSILQLWEVVWREPTPSPTASTSD